MDGSWRDSTDDLHAKQTPTRTPNHSGWTHNLSFIIHHLWLQIGPAGLTSDTQIDKDLLVALSRAGVALVPALVLHFDPPQEQGGVAMGDLRVEQGRPPTEVFVLQSELVLAVVVAVDGDLLLVPVDHHRAGGPEAAGEDAVFADDAVDAGI